MSFQAKCPNCHNPLLMMPYKSDFRGNEWVGRCPHDHFIQLRVSKVAPPQDCELGFDPPAISIRNSKLGRRKR